MKSSALPNMIRRSGKPLSVALASALLCAWTPTQLEDQARKALDEGLILPIIAAPAEGRRCDGEAGNSRIITPLKFAGQKNNWIPPANLVETEEPIRSSVAVATDFLLVGKFSRARSVERQYFEASARHDLCYQHGKYTYASEREACNDRIFADMRRLCALANDRSRWGLSGCAVRPWLVWKSVSLFGGLFSRLTGSSQTGNVCEYEPAGFPPSRDHLVIGHFQGDRGTEQVLELSVGKSSRPEEKCVPKMLLRGRLFSGTIQTQAFTLCLSEITLAKGRRNLNLEEIGMTAVDFLSHAPIRAQLEGPNQAADDIVLLGFHGAGKNKGDSASGYGAIMVPLKLGHIRETQAFQVMLGGDAKTPEWNCGLKNYDDCWKLQGSAVLDQQRELLLAPIHNVHLMPGCPAVPASMCADGDQLLFVHTTEHKNDQEFLVFSTVAFRYRPGTGFELIGVNRAQFHHREAYKRFQHPPIVFRDLEGKDAVHFLFRDPTERDLTTLVVESIRPDRDDNAALNLSWPNPEQPQHEIQYARVLNWSRETFVWMTLGKSTSSLGSENDSAKEKLVGTFLTNCTKVGGTTAQGKKSGSEPSRRGKRCFTLAPRRSSVTISAP